MRRVVLLSSVFVMMVNATAVIVALPAILDDFSIHNSTGHWLITAYFLTLAVVTPSVERICVRFSVRKFFTLGIAAFLLGTIATALGPHFVILLLARFVQASGTAVMVVLARSTGFSTIVSLLGLGLGPVVAGIVLSVATWQWFFWALVPVVVIIGLVGVLRLPKVGGAQDESLDGFSAVLLACAFVALIYTLSDLSSVWVPPVVIFGLIALGIFTIRQVQQGRSYYAFLDFRPMGFPMFVLSLMVLIALVGGMLGGMSLIALYVQQAFELSPQFAGALVAPLAVVPTVMWSVITSMYARIGSRLLIVTGALIVVGSFFWLAALERDAQLWLVAVIVAVCSVGLAMAFAPLRATAMETLPVTLQRSGSRWLATLLPLGGAAGIAIMSGWYWQVVNGITDLTLSEVATFAGNVTFFDAGLLGLLPLVLALFITRRPPNGNDDTQALGPTTTPTDRRSY